MNQVEKDIIIGLIGDIRDNADDKAMVQAIANVLIGELSAE
jgi:hypothetical protein